MMKEILLTLSKIQQMKTLATLTAVSGNLLLLLALFHCTSSAVAFAYKQNKLPCLWVF